MFIITNISIYFRTNVIHIFFLFINIRIGFDFVNINDPIYFVH